MLGAQNVVVNINSTANTAGVTKMQAALTGLNASAKTTNARLAAVGSQTSSNSRLMGKNSEALGAVGTAFTSSSKAARGFLKFVGKVMKLALIGAAIETLALAVALSSVNALLKTGSGLVRAWNATVTGTAVATANAVAGVATLAAIFTQAMRQFTAAQASASYGGNFRESSQALRTMQADGELAVFGLTAVNAAFAAASKNAKVTGASVASIRGLSDFAVASGDMEKGLIAASNLVTLLQSGKGSGSAEILNVARELGPEFEKAYKKATASGKTSNKELLALFASGELSRSAGIEGTSDNVRQSLMGQLKSFGTDFQVLFADIGQGFIGPTQKSFHELTRIFRRTVVQMTAQMNLFAKGPFQNVMVAGVDKLGTFTAKLVNEYLPRTQEVLDKFGAWWSSTSNATKDMFSRMDRFLTRFSEASKEINTFFGGIFRRIGSEFGDSFESFASLAIDNKENFQEFGKSIENLIGSIFDLFRQIRTSFFAALPAINSIVNTLASLIGVLTTALEMLGSFGAVGSLGGLVAMGVGGSMLGKGGKGGRGKGVGKIATSLPVLAASAAIIPSLMPSLGFGGDLASGLMLGGLGGARLAGPGITKHAAALADVTAQNDVIRQQYVQNIGKHGQYQAGLMHKQNPFLPDPVKSKFARAGRMGAGGAVLVGGAMATDKLSSVVEDKFGNTAATMGTSIAVGAATGAAVGAIFAGASFGLSVAIGAAIGAVAGAITAWIKSGKAKKQAAEAGRQFGGGYADEVTRMVQTGNLRVAEQGIADFGRTLEETSKKVARASEFRAAGEEEFGKRMKEIRPAVDMFNRNLQDLTTITGLAEEQLIATAMAADVDLSSNLLRLQDILSQTGLVVGAFGQDFNTAISMALGDAVHAIHSAFDILNAPNVLDEAGKAFREKADAGTITDDDRLELLTTVYEQATAMFADDPLKAAQFVQDQIGTVSDPGLQFTSLGGDLSGLGSDFFKGGGAALAAAGEGAFLSNLRTFIGDNIVSAVTASEGTINRAAVDEALKNMTFQELLNAGGEVRNANFLEGGFGRAPTDILGHSQFVTTGAESTIAELLGLDEKSIAIRQSEASKVSDAVTGLGFVLKPLEQALETFNKNIDALIAAVTGDTATPRGNLVSTMSKHNSLDMSISGKRSVTSSLRNVGLGSRSSDHASGLAYDLTGQNLGMYQSAVQAGGGFAEFHGGGGSRHLHVVPGNVPVGDSATPVMAATRSSGSSYSSSDSYTINVYPTEGMSSAQIAEEVMSRISREQRSGRERS